MDNYDLPMERSGVREKEEAASKNIVPRVVSTAFYDKRTMKVQYYNLLLLVKYGQNVKIPENKILIPGPGF